MSEASKPIFSREKLPEFVDNRQGRTLLAGLIALASEQQGNTEHPPRLDIASGYFNLAGFRKASGIIQSMQRVRLLLGAEPLDEPMAAPLAADRSTRARRAKVIERELGNLDVKILSDRNHLSFTPETEELIERLRVLDQEQRLEVRRYTKDFLHGKAFIFDGGRQAALSGSSNFTAAGLEHNLELNVGTYQPTPYGQMRQWFEDLWEEAEPYDLAKKYEERLDESYPPYLIYLRVLLEFYGEESEDDARFDSSLNVTPFQMDGIMRAKRILKERNGVIIADSVGLGKSYIAGYLMQEAWEARRQRVLLVVPAALRDGSWAEFRERENIQVDTLSYEQFRDAPAETLYKYAMIVLDEGHNLRNPSARRSQRLWEIMRSEHPPKLVILTATPVNNSLWDVFHLIRYFCPQDAAFAHQGIISLRQRFEEAAKEDPESLKPAQLFPILDAVAVRRSRRFIKKHYPNAVLRRGDREIPIHFPKPIVRKLEYSFTDRLSAFLGYFGDQIAPKDDTEPPLLLARYRLSRYRLQEGGEASFDKVNNGLLRSGMLKRLESSVFAFRATLERMIESYSVFIEGVDEGWVLRSPAVRRILHLRNTGKDWDWKQLDALLEDVFEGDSSSDGDVESEVEDVARELHTDFTKFAEVASGFDTKVMLKDARSDVAILKQMLSLLDTLIAEDYRGKSYADVKVKAFASRLVEIIQLAEAAGRDEEERRDARKLVIFSQYADTVNWLRSALQALVKEDERLAHYAGRITSVHGDSDPSAERKALHGFAPKSASASPETTEDLYDILIATDKLAEGQNLQQARNLCNWDLPWNPMRLVQRHGRIDRIGSNHAEIQIHCFFPDEELEDLLKLEERIQKKIVQAARSIGVDGEVIPGMSSEFDPRFAETRDEILKLRSENPDIFDLGGEYAGPENGEEYRRELKLGLEREGEKLRALPMGVGTSFRTLGKKGFLFCARIEAQDEDRTIQCALRFVYENDTRLIDAEPLRCLLGGRCEPSTDSAFENKDRAEAYTAWQMARSDIMAEWQKLMNPAIHLPDAPKSFREAQVHISNNPIPGKSGQQLDLVLARFKSKSTPHAEHEIRKVLNKPGLDGVARSIELEAVARKLGLEPQIDAAKRPPISEEDIHLVCWLRAK